MNTATMSKKKKQKFNYQYVEYNDAGSPTGKKATRCPEHSPKSPSFKLVLLGTTDLPCETCVSAKDSNTI